MEKEKNDEKLGLVTKEDMTYASGLILNTKQLQFLFKRTPQHHVKQRDAKGGGKWNYVSGGYVQKVLNLMFGWNWDFVINKSEHFLEPINQVIVHGSLIVRIEIEGKVVTLTKSQIGNKDIAFMNEYANDESGKRVKKKTNKPLDLGNDYKAAATDCLKKCASQIGIAADVYNKEDFKEVSLTSNEEETPPVENETTDDNNYGMNFNL